MKPFLLAPSEGREFDYGCRHIVKCGELNPGRGAAIFEMTTQPGEEPPLHSHPTEDEAFYVLEGELKFHCDGEDYPAPAGSFMYLPSGSKHGYTILSEHARLLVMTFPVGQYPDGWGGYVRDVELS